MKDDNRQTIRKIEMLSQGSQHNADFDDLEFIWADLRKGVKSVIQSNQQGSAAIYIYKIRKIEKIKKIQNTNYGNNTSQSTEDGLNQG